MKSKQLDRVLDSHLETVAKLMNTQENCSNIDESFILSVLDFINQLQQEELVLEDEIQRDKLKKIYESLSTLLTSLQELGEKEKKAISDELLLLQRRKSAKQQYQP